MLQGKKKSVGKYPRLRINNNKNPQKGRYECGIGDQDVQGCLGTFPTLTGLDSEV